MKMIDVSNNNGHIDWSRVGQAGIKAVMVKCSEGLTFTDPNRKVNALGARSIGAHVGYYHFAQPAIGHAVPQAEYALRAIDKLPRDIGLTLDLERANGMSWSQLATFAENFLARIAKEGITSPIYINEYWLSKLPGAPFGHKLWLASWGSVKPTGNLWAWQYSGTGTCPGVSGQCDLDNYYG
jgi:lysozyme